MSKASIKQIEKAIKFFKEKPGYIKKSADYVAQILNIKPDNVIIARKDARATKAVRKVTKKVKETVEIDSIEESVVRKRLFFDIEVSPNIVASWSIGYKINLSYDNILRERAIICICYKWEGEDTVHSLQWNNGDDKQMLEKFVKIAESADQIVGHNGDSFDLKWIRTRCIFHGIRIMPDFKTIDTLKLSKSGFRFNSNRLDYIGKFLGIGGKLETTYDLWKKITLDNCSKSLHTMVEYCKVDVIRLEQVFEKLNPYVKHKVHYGVANGGRKIDCPECASDNVRSNGNRYTAAGTHFKMMKCNDCHKYYQVSATIYQKYMR